ncbi:MAG: hypothetical protein HY865_18555 [Chloroflexi bacterium]|nr:hypothetical protein [Chloroflexota bacterium]
MNYRDQFRICSLTWVVRNGKPGLPIISVQDQCDWFCISSINQQDHHLTVTLIRSMIWAWAIVRSSPGDMQIESLYGTQARLQ